MIKSIYGFLECGIPENGVARVRCDSCGYDYFVAFSCRARITCPSCSTKRSLLFGEKVAEIVKPLPHLHVTFTIPKILRGYFKRNRKLLKFFVQSAQFAMNTYFKESLGIDDGYCGGIYCVQTQGTFYNFHPHVHALIPSGILKDGLFTCEKNPSAAIIARLFRARLLNVLTEEGVISDKLVDLLLSWNHNSGFSVHMGKRKINGKESRKIENASRYMSRAAISVERVVFDPARQKVTVLGKQNQHKSSIPSKSYSIMEFLALLACHIPSTYESLVYYYGIYSSSYRGKEKRAEREEEVIEVVEENGNGESEKGKASSAWARLIRKIFEVDPLQCPHCHNEMKIIAFITDWQEVRKILKHIGEETIRPPPFNHSLVNQPELTESWEQEIA